MDLIFLYFMATEKFDGRNFIYDYMNERNVLFIFYRY